MTVDIFATRREFDQLLDQLTPASIVDAAEFERVQVQVKDLSAGHRVNLDQVVPDRWQRGTLRGLGLTRRGRCVVVRSTPPILGMISKVSHLVTVED